MIGSLGGVERAWNEKGRDHGRVKGRAGGRCLAVDGGLMGDRVDWWLSEH